MPPLTAHGHPTLVPIPENSREREKRKDSRVSLAPPSGLLRGHPSSPWPCRIVQGRAGKCRSLHAILGATSYLALGLSAHHGTRLRTPAHASHNDVLHWSSEGQARRPQKAK
jgi:hypothetical protein